jgi:hypothetical protein
MNFPLFAIWTLLNTQLSTSGRRSEHKNARGYSQISLAIPWNFIWAALADLAVDNFIEMRDNGYACPALPRTKGRVFMKKATGLDLLQLSFELLT